MFPELSHQPDRTRSRGVMLGGSGARNNEHTSMCKQDCPIPSENHLLARSHFSTSRGSDEFYLARGHSWSGFTRDRRFGPLRGRANLRPSIFPDTFGWTNAYFAGMPLPNFYPPLFFWIVSFLHHTHLFSFAAAFKLVIALPLLLMPLAFWCVAYRLSGKNQGIAFGAAIASATLYSVGEIFQPNTGLDHVEYVARRLLYTAVGICAVAVLDVVLLESATRRSCGSRSSTVCWRLQCWRISSTRSRRLFSSPRFCYATSSTWTRSSDLERAPTAAEEFSSAFVVSVAGARIVSFLAGADA